jgi:integrase
MAQVKYGTGTIFQTKDGRWKWQGYFVDDTGKKHRPTKTFNTEAEALKFQAEQVAKTEVKKAMKSKDITLAECFDLWKEAVKEGSVKISETTRKNTIQNFNKHLLPLLGHQQLNKLNVTTLKRYFTKLRKDGSSVKTVYNIYTDLKQVVKYAMKQGIIYEDPLSGFDIEKPKASGQVVNVMTFAEYEAIVSNPENKKSYYLPAIMFLAETGLRVEELAIKKTDYHLTESGTAYIVINKSIVRALTDDDKSTELRLMDNVKNDASVRKVPLNAFAQNAVENQLAYCKENEIRSPFIFCTTTGAMLDQRNLLRALHMMCENAGIPKRGLHSLRKLFINHTLRQGITPFDLAKVTGHSVQTMFKYYHDLDEELLTKIANASENRK